MQMFSFSASLLRAEMFLLLCVVVLLCTALTDCDAVQSDWLFLVMSIPLSWDSVSCCSGHLSCASGGLGDSFASDSYAVSGIRDRDL